MAFSKLSSPLWVHTLSSRISVRRTMATVNNSSLSHIQRTSSEPRNKDLHRVTIDRIDFVNDSIRLFQLRPNEGEVIKYLPGQWLDVYCPGIPKAGGFTITSSPPLLHRRRLGVSADSLFSSPTIELAIQKSPKNPPAVWLWQDQSTILGQELQVRVGGSFVWPPTLLRTGSLNRVVFIAGGVGINPLVSMLGSIADMKKLRAAFGLGFEVVLLYSTRTVQKPGQILFLARLKKVFEHLATDGNFKLFLTNGTEKEVNNVEDLVVYTPEESNITSKRGRISDQDLEHALGDVSMRSGTVCYICGVPSMTDEMAEKIKTSEGMKEENVLYEKWW